MTSEQAGELPRQWVREIEQTSRESMGPAVASAVAAALEAFAEENFEAAARSAAQAKANAPRSAMVQEILGLSLYHLGSWKEALTELMSYRRISGGRDQNHVIADCYRALDRPEKANEICAEVSQTEVSAEVWAETMIVAAGALADRLDRRRVMRNVQVLRVAVMGGLAALALIDGLSLPALYVAAIVLGIGETLFDTSTQSIMPSVVAKDQLALANG
ncbi:MAG: MFS transporter, partial [Actinobacteria bacterium]|nr:MFS transporter [Actinomycetota bacterium]